MGTRKKVGRTQLPAPGTDLHEILDGFSEAISLVRVARTSLSTREVAADEEEVLQRALSLLDLAYGQLDLASGRAVRPS